jgi:predicted ATPase
MIYLDKFKLLSEKQEYSAFVRFNIPSNEDEPLENAFFVSHTQDEYYPYQIFPQKIFEYLDFDDITIFYGGNGSGKTTLLNIIADKLALYRISISPQTIGFNHYIKNCGYSVLQPISVRSKFLSSDDVFNHILSVRAENKEIKLNKQNERNFFDRVKKEGSDFVFPKGVHVDFESENSKEEIEKLSRLNSVRKKSARQFVRSRAGELKRQFSNGENALMFFDKQIEENSLYLLDEPENSLSPQFQIELKYLIEDSVRHKNCQFIIATHSPFILSLNKAKIYDLDETPVTVKKWYELENIRFMYDFFKQNGEYFYLRF